MTPPELLVFDLDGTLIDSSTDLCLSVNAMLEAFGRPGLPVATITGYIGDGAAALVRRALENSHGSRPETASFSEKEFGDAHDFFIRYYREHKLDNTTLYDGVREALQQIRDAKPHVLMAVLTNKPVRPSREICRGLGIEQFFFQNYGGDSFPAKKPDPQGLHVLIEEATALRQKRMGASAGLEPAQVMMIGDSGVDVKTARRCGVRVLGCAFGLAPESMMQAQPDFVVQHASEWPTALGFTVDGVQAGNQDMNKEPVLNV